MYRTSIRLLGFFLVPLVFHDIALHAGAQEVQWRHDYNEARREALEKERPIILDFGTENCFWCKKLDAVTFHDAEVVRRVNGQFVPLRIDAGKEAVLAEKLGIQVYPTVVLASPEGKILARIEGFKEP